MPTQSWQCVTRVDDVLSGTFRISESEAIQIGDKYPGGCSPLSLQRWSIPPVSNRYLLNIESEPVPVVGKSDKEVPSHQGAQAWASFAQKLITSGHLGGSEG